MAFNLKQSNAKCWILSQEAKWKSSDFLEQQQQKQQIKRKVVFVFTTQSVHPLPPPSPPSNSIWMPYLFSCSFLRSKWISNEPIYLLRHVYVDWWCGFVQFACIFVCTVCDIIVRLQSMSKHRNREKENNKRIEIWKTCNIF